MTTSDLKVIGKDNEARDAASLWLDVPQDLKGAFQYEPGQFLTVENEKAGERIARQYSLSSTPGHHQALRITVKKIPEGQLSPWLVDQVSEGQTIEVQVPRGRFFRDFTQPRHVVMLACGSGIPPILSIARHLLSLGAGHRITLVYGNKTPDTVILRDEVDALAREYSDTCALMHVMSRAGEAWQGARGRIDPPFIGAHLPGWKAVGPALAVFLCGPDDFMDTAENAFTEDGIALTDIHRESFDLVLNDDENEPG